MPQTRLECWSLGNQYGAIPKIVSEAGAYPRGTHPIKILRAVPMVVSKAGAYPRKTHCADHSIKLLRAIILVVSKVRAYPRRTHCVALFCQVITAYTNGCE
jgi:hypothetical protein